MPKENLPRARYLLIKQLRPQCNGIEPPAAKRFLQFFLGKFHGEPPKTGQTRRRTSNHWPGAEASTNSPHRTVAAKFGGNANRSGKPDAASSSATCRGRKGVSLESPFQASTNSMTKFFPKACATRSMVERLSLIHISEPTR